MATADRNSITTEIYRFSKVVDFSEFGCFDCGDSDLNDFIANDARKHAEELIAETYSLRFVQGQQASAPVAFISLSNDAIRLSEPLKRNIPNELQYKELPAVKVGRLGVAVKYQGLNVGTELLNLTKEIFTTDNRTGCRFITIDAYNKPRVLGFYQKNGFDFISVKDEQRHTRQMFFDLKTFRRK